MSIKEMLKGNPIAEAQVEEDSTGEKLNQRVIIDDATPIRVQLDESPTIDIGDVQVKAGNENIGAVKDNGSFWTHSKTVTQSANATSGADASGAPTTGQKIVIDDIIVSVDTAMAVTIEEETSGTDIAKFYMDANTTLQVTPRNGLKLATADKKVRIVTSVAGNISSTITYHSEA